MDRRAWGLRGWWDARQRAWRVRFGRLFRSLPAGGGPRVLLFCDCEGHYAGEEGRQAAEVGLDRLLALLDRLNVRITFNVVAGLCQSHPQRVRRIASAGHEIACHGWQHERPRDLSPDRLDACLAAAVEAFGGLAIRPTGFRSPQSAWSAALLRRLPAHGFMYDAERDHAPRPYRIAPALIRVPVTADDWPLVRGRCDVAGLIARWQEQIDSEVSRGKILVFGVHEWIIGRHPGFAPALAGWLAAARARFPDAFAPLVELLRPAGSPAAGGAAR